jgi:hypothetical protein
MSKIEKEVKTKKSRGDGKRFEKGNTVGANTAFKPGQSGNPGGRPKSVATTIKESINALSDDSVLIAKAMAAIAKNEELSPKDRYPFMRDVLDRVMGRPHTNSEDEVKALREELRDLKLTTQQMQLAVSGKVEDTIKSLYRDGKLHKMIEEWDGEAKK